MDNVNNNKSNVNHNELSANNIPNAEQQLLRQSDRDIRAARRNRGVVLADPIHHAHTAFLCSAHLSKTSITFKFIK